MDSLPQDKPDREKEGPKPRFMLLGVGNELRGDDGLGPYIAREMDSPHWLTIEGGTAPSNFTAPVRRVGPEKLVIVDAAKMGLDPGTYRLLSPEEGDRVYLSTHDLPLAATASYLSQFAEEIIFIGIEPEELKDGIGLSETARKAAWRVIRLLEEEKFDSLEKLNTG